MKSSMSRRRFLRGSLQGAAVTVALPFLDCLLNEHGTAFAGTGEPLPVVFGTWYQALGYTPGRWVPSSEGRGFDVPAALKALAPYRDKINLFSGMAYFHDGRPAVVHSTEVASTGHYGGKPQPSIDALIGDVIGTRTRFKSLEVSLAGDDGSVSRSAGSTTNNPSERSALALYTRLFGPGFTDPNSSDFKPDPRVLAEKSVLSAVDEDRRRILTQLGYSDRARLDEYFTSIRQIEKQLAMSLEKPAPLAGCTVPKSPGVVADGPLPEQVDATAKAMYGLVTHAVACGQTRVINMHLGRHDRIRRIGEAGTWHSLTHEEPVDLDLGYQREVAWFMDWATSVFGDFLGALQNYKEGAGSVLDRCVVLWMTDHSDARVHSVENVPVMMAGTGGGRFRTGMHLALPGDPTTRVGLTLQQGLGVPTSSWGSLSNGTSRTIADIVV